ncbi:MAG: P1 family peptidase [Mogibacterium sp.]|nr:P1 family peptidase [Mogibacterium sp.]
MGIPAEYGLRIGKMPAGRLNQITDVPGVSVSHVTLRQGRIQTGVTAVRPHQGNCFREKCPAAVHVINGFGKSTGLVQVQELGTIETPLLLTNTFSVGTASTALIRHMLEENPDIGTTTGSVNPVVFECNDGKLSDIRGMHVTEDHAKLALERSRNAEPSFEEGAVGAGTGMVCYGLKGGIGSASRLIGIGGITYTLGVMVLTNFGKVHELVIDGEHTGERIKEKCEDKYREEPDRGSIIVLIATDLPLTARQLGRISRRAQNGIARTGSITATGSGEIVLSFSTANRISHYPDADICGAEYLHEERLDTVFAAVCEAVEESIISSLLHAEVDEALTGKILSLKELLGDTNEKNNSIHAAGNVDPERMQWC